MASLIIISLILTIAVTLFAILPVSNAVVNTNHTFLYCSVSPLEIGVGQKTQLCVLQLSKLAP
jgi:hypothetical protein